MSNEGSPDAVVDLTVMASNLAHFLLIQERSRLGVKKADIVEKILKGNSGLLRDVMLEANRILEHNLGYKIQEVPGKRVYIVTNTMDFSCLEAYLTPDKHWEHVRGLICIILSLILMSSGESIEESQLWGFLQQINVNRDDKRHPVFGDVEKMIKSTLVKQHYLDYVKEKNGSGKFSWGFRAQHEFKPMELLRFVADVYGDGKSASDFTTTYKRIFELEKEVVQSAEQES
ncbi:melanoma-associated antigen G1-like [Tropilaelaps mercedesae]|uniref:Melanoma-associated antigen G1-like n=1 Tax=Tropilaelaps mercedesae TaxID=418985 RepID=A0A1V9XEF7_9ACAR|nr:melanoma-associated antigen G1-like [Tropilaelaps mercedesae]